jgi:gliding motility-associated-like protein
MEDYLNAPAYVIVTVIVGDTLSDFQAQNDTITTKEDIQVAINVLANDTIGSESPDPRTVQLKVFPENGVAIFDPEKEIIVYTPDQDFNGSDSLTYVVSTGPGNWSFASVLITVTPVSDPFEATDDYAETKVEVPVSIDISANDSDPDNRIDEISVITPPNHGSASVEPNGVIRFIPVAGFTGVDTLVYGVCDTLTETAACDSAKVIIIVTPAEKVFFAQNDVYTTSENKALPLVPSPIDNDENKANPTILVNPESFSIISGPLQGSYIVFEDTIIYTPNADYYGPDWMQYIVADEEGNWDMAEINIWVNEVNDPPVAVNDTAIVTKNAYNRLFVLENDYDSDGTLNWSTLKIIGNPSKGTVQVDTQTGTIKYKPSINSGFDSFTYEISDNDGAPAQATVFITIELETTLYIYTTTPEDTPVTIDLAGKMAEYNLNFTITDILKQEEPDLGTYTFRNSNREMVYSPSRDLIGKDTIFMQVWPANHTEGTAYLRIFITITPVNDAPVAIADTLHWLNAPDTLVVPFSDILRNDYDVDGDTLLLTQSIINAGYSDLHVEFNATDSTITITSDSIEWCNAWFTYEIKDRGGKSDTSKVVIWPPLNGIVANDDNVTVDENSLSNQVDVLANDDFVDNQRCTIDSIMIITPPQHGTAISSSAQRIVYSPTRHYYGIDSLQYMIIDRFGQSDFAWVNIEVLQKNTPPEALNDTIYNRGSVINISVLSNDNDPDAVDFPGSPGDPDAYIDSAETYVLVPPLYGNALFDSLTMTVIYTPVEKTCIDSFTYVIFDNERDSAMATVIVDFSDAPVVAVTDIQKVYPGITFEVEPLLNDNGYFIPELTEFEQTYSLHGTVNWNADNVVSYTSDKDFIGRDSIRYAIFSPCGNEQSAWIVFSVEELRVPEIITPNGDTKNDVLIIDGIEYFPDNLLQIYNRYGHIVYEKKRYDNSWGGYSNKGSFGGNKPLPAGTYYYTLIYNEGKNRQAGFIYIFL